MTSSTTDLLSTLSFRRKPPKFISHNHSASRSSAFSHWVDLAPPSTSFTTAATNDFLPESPPVEGGLGRSRDGREIPGEARRSFSFTRNISGPSRTPSTKFSFPWSRRSSGSAPSPAANDENQNPNMYAMTSLNDTGKPRGPSKLKRRSMQLLRMVSEGRKSVEVLSSTQGCNEENAVVNGIRCELSTPPRTPATPAWSTPSLTLYSKPTPLTLIRGDSGSSDSSTPRSPLHTTSKHSSPPRLSTPHFQPLYCDVIPTPPSDRPYPFVLGDSPFHQTSPPSFLRPYHSRAPNNTPHTSFESAYEVAGAARGVNKPIGAVGSRTIARASLDCEGLINEPLPPPNGEPNRYVVYTGRETDILPGAVLQNDISLGIPDLADPEEPTFEINSALEALWEYGSADSTSDLDISMTPTDDDDGTEPVEPALNSSTTEVQFDFPTPPMDIPSPPGNASRLPASVSDINSLSSPMSECTLSSLIDEAESVSTTMAYRLPLKYERPQARPKLNGKSPFASLYKADSDSLDVKQ